MTALCCAVAACIGVAAHAGPRGDSGSYGDIQQEIHSESFTAANIGGFKNVNIPQFDPQGGCRELLGVTLASEGVGTGDYSLTNDSDILCTGFVTINYGASVTFPYPPAPLILYCDQAGSVGPVPIALNPGETLDLPGVIDFQFSCTDTTDGGDDLTPFIGTGTIVARWDGDQDTDTEVDCDFTESLNTDFEGSITVTYEYQINAPECTITGPLTLCPGDEDVEYTVTTTPPDQPVDIVWDIQGDAQFCPDPAGGESAFVCADPVCGSFTLTVTVTNPQNPTECFGQCTLTVQLVDDDPPIITCPPDTTVSCKDSTHPDDTGYATATDDCSGLAGDPTWSDSVSGDCPVTITRTWSVSDICGNPASCIQTITVRTPRTRTPPAMPPPPTTATT
ncbi:MAG: choice-of-anchor E domain-containing protein [Planctomycetota bacterium]|jgi:hypothetical protein